jgi:hypothetical protein
MVSGWNFWRQDWRRSFAADFSGRGQASERKCSVNTTMKTTCTQNLMAASERGFHPASTNE